MTHTRSMFVAILLIATSGCTDLQDWTTKIQGYDWIQGFSSDNVLGKELVKDANGRTAALPNPWFEALVVESSIPNTGIDNQKGIKIGAVASANQYFKQIAHASGSVQVSVTEETRLVLTNPKKYGMAGFIPLQDCHNKPSIQIVYETLSTGDLCQAKIFNTNSSGSAQAQIGKVQDALKQSTQSIDAPDDITPPPQFSCEKPPALRGVTVRDAAAINTTEASEVISAAFKIDVAGQQNETLSGSNLIVGMKSNAISCRALATKNSEASLNTSFVVFREIGLQISLGQIWNEGPNRWVLISALASPIIQNGASGTIIDTAAPPFVLTNFSDSEITGLHERYPNCGTSKRDFQQPCALQVGTSFGIPSGPREGLIVKSSRGILNMIDFHVHRYAFRWE